jgi:hypothetical protein
LLSVSIIDRLLLLRRRYFLFVVSELLESLVSELRVFDLSDMAMVPALLL